MQDDQSRNAPWELRVVAGPDAGRSIPLPKGSTVIGGRGCRGGVAVDDDALAPFHLAIDVTDHAVEVHPLADPHLRTGTLEPGEPMPVGASVMWLARPDRSSRPALPSDGGVRPHHRPPRQRPAAEPAPPSSPASDAPVPLPAVMSPVPALVGTAVTVGIAMMIGQPMLALLGLSGAAVALATWSYGMIDHRRRRRARVRHDEARARHRAELLQRHHNAASVHRRLVTDDLCRAVAWAHSHDTRLWQRRPAHDDVWHVVLGLGEAAIDHGDAVAAAAGHASWWGVLRDAPVVVDLSPGALVGVSGSADAARALVRSLIVQLVSSVGPADLQVTVEVDRLEMLECWRWLDTLPHSTRIGLRNDDSVSPPHLDRHRIRVVDVDDAVTLLAGADAVIVIAPTSTDVPASASSFGSIDDRGHLRWFTAQSGGLPTPIATARCPRPRAASVATALAHLSDPDDTSGAALVPMSLGELIELDTRSVLERWRAAGDDPPPLAVLGRTSDGSSLQLDLARDGPHAVVGGTTGSGKSEMLRSLVVALAASSPPAALSFVLVDFKGGAAFDACLDLPHVVGVLTDLDARSTERALRSLDAELHRREQLLRDAGSADLTAYRRFRSTDQPAIARLVIVVDEFASLAMEMPSTLRALVGVAQRGRSLGVHLVLATQRPAGVITDDISANTAIRIALRVATSGESLDIVGDPSAALFPRDRPGRAMLRFGPDEPVVAQIASCVHPTDGGDDDPLGQAVAAICDAHARHGDPLPHRPWLPALPECLGPGDLEHPFDHGVIDDPLAQCRRPLRWNPADGHLVVVGAVGSGCTATLETVVRQTVAARADAEVHVIDGVGDRRWDQLLDVVAVGSVIRLDDTERLERLLAHAADTVHGRRGTGDAAALFVLVVDGLAGLRRALDDDSLQTGLLFDTIVAGGVATGVVVLGASDHAAAVPLALAARASQRWVHALSDPLDASALGANVRAVPDETAPPGRILVVPGMWEAQVLQPGGHAPPHRSCRPARAIGVLPPVVERSMLPSSHRERGMVALTVGVGARDLQPITVLVERGEHLAVVGPARSGRTTVLSMLSAEWLTATGQPPVLLRPRHAATWHAGDDVVRCTSVEEVIEHLGASSDTSSPHARAESLVVVDDADRVDDVGGHLERLASAGDVSMAVALRPERLRGAFGHWTGAIRRSRSGIVLGSAAHADGGDFLGVVLPRRSPVPAAPGRGWWVDDGVVRDVVQTPLPGPLSSRTEGSCASTRWA